MIELDMVYVSNFGDFLSKGSRESFEQNILFRLSPPRKAARPPRKSLQEKPAWPGRLGTLVGTAGKDLQLVILSHQGMSYLKGDERRLCYSDLVRRAKRLGLRLNKVVVITTPTLLRLDS